MRRRCMFLLVALALVVAACGGSASPAPTSAGPATGAPTSGPTDAPTDGPTDAPATQSAGTDVSDAASAIDSLASYQLEISVVGIVPSASGTTGITMTALVDRANDAVDFTLAGFEGLAAMGDSLRVILIGQDAWLDLGTGTFVAQPGGASSFGNMIESLSPAAILGEVPGGAFSGLTTVGNEDRNGVATVHYRIDSTVPGFADSLGEDGQADIWVAVDGGYLVSMTMVGTTESDGESVDVDMSFDISRVNDPTIVIRPPG